MKNFLDEREPDWEDESYLELQQLLLLYEPADQIGGIKRLARRAGMKDEHFPVGYSNANLTAEAFVRVAGGLGMLRQIALIASKESDSPYVRDGFAALLERPPRSSLNFGNTVGLELVEVKAGPFIMGSEPGEGIGPEELEHHEVYLDTYHIGKYPVTNAQYVLFLEKNEYANPKVWPTAGIDLLEPDSPVAGVTWYQAMAYCEWLSTSHETYRLPSEAQWEKAARGTEGQLYPWDGDWDETKCNVAPNVITSVRASEQWPSPFGCVDMVGNLSEWTTTRWGELRHMPDERYGRQWRLDTRDSGTSSEVNDQVRRVTRGGRHWKQGHPVHCAWRRSQLPRTAGMPQRSMGFRVVMTTKDE